jgi:hypothetical protein
MSSPALLSLRPPVFNKLDGLLPVSFIQINFRCFKINSAKRVVIPDLAPLIQATCRFLRYHPLDYRPPNSYIHTLLVYGGTFREGTFESGTRAVPARGVTTRARAAPGISHGGTKAGAGGAVPGLGQVKAGNARWIRVPGSMAWS